MDDEQTSVPAGGEAGDGAPEESAGGGAGGNADSGTGGGAGVRIGSLGPIEPAEPGMDEDGEGGPRATGTRWWTRRPLAVSTTTLAAIAVLTLAAVVQSPSARAGAHATTTSEPAAAPSSSPSTPPAQRFTPIPVPSTSAPVTTPATTPPATKKPTSTPAPKPTSTAPPSAQDELGAAMKALTDSDSGHFSVAVTELDGGTVATYDSGATTTYDTASIVKVDILASLLLQHQRSGTQLTATQRELATEMIEQSDNDAALALWNTIGAGPGLRSANKTLGLDHTTPGSGELWGLTQTTAADQIALLRAVYGDADDSPLNAASRAYISGLMHSVVADQRWGVSAADSDDSGYALKNGWLPRSATGLWDINSIGEVQHDGRTLLVAVLSGGHLSEQAGISLVERVAAAAAKAVA